MHAWTYSTPLEFASKQYSFSLVLTHRSVAATDDVTIRLLLELLNPALPPLPPMQRDVYLPTSLCGILEMMSEKLNGAALFVAGGKRTFFWLLL